MIKEKRESVKKRLNQITPINPFPLNRSLAANLCHDIWSNSLPLSNVSAHCDEINSEGVLLNFKLHIFLESHNFFKNISRNYLKLCNINNWDISSNFCCILGILNCIRDHVFSWHIYHITSCHSRSSDHFIKYRQKTWELVSTHCESVFYCKGVNLLGFLFCFTDSNWCSHLYIHETLFFQMGRQSFWYSN